MDVGVCEYMCIVCIGVLLLIGRFFGSVFCEGV